MNGFTPHLPSQSLSALSTAAGPDWARWHVVWADERVVPLAHPDSNFKLAMVPPIPLQPPSLFNFHSPECSPQMTSPSSLW